MVDFVMMDKSLKAAWAKRLCEAGDSKWCAAFSLATTHLGGTFLFECNFDIHDLNLSSELPSFYKEILSAWQEIQSTDPSSADEYGNEIIWNNRFIRIDGKPIFFLSWYQKGVIKIRDLLVDGRFLSITEFQDKYGLKVNFLKYYGLLSAIPSRWKKFLWENPNPDSCIQKRILRFFT